MPQAQQNPITISTKQMREAIKRSGYLLEQRIEPILAEEGYYAQTNTAFLDADTGKSREIDISALSGFQVFKKGIDFIFPFILCECENNAQPVVFFTKESIISFMHHEQVKVSGIPVKFWQKDGWVSLSEFTGMEKFHHYCKGSIATQYCTFQFKKDKTSWFALHNEEQHDTFNSLIKAVDYEMAKHFDGWSLPDKLDDEGININIYYPLLILQSGLYSATLKNKELTLRKSKHIQFRKERLLPRTNEVETYQIDVITEEYLADYLKIINSEIEKTIRIFRRHRADILTSIEKLIQEAKKLKDPKSYRECLEF